MFKFIEQTFIALLSFRRSLATKCLYLNNEPYLAIPTLSDLNELYQNELHYFLFIVSLDR